MLAHRAGTGPGPLREDETLAVRPEGERRLTRTMMRRLAFWRLIPTVRLRAVNSTWPLRSMRC